MTKSDTPRTVWVVSTEPASTDYGPGATSSQIRFKEEVNIGKLKAMMSEFCRDLGDIFDGLQSVGKDFQLDAVEISAVMAADGKLGILGASIGGKAEGALKFIVKRRQT